MRSVVILLSLLLFLVNTPPSNASPSRVLVVENLSSPASVTIAQYYFLQRHIPPMNLCTIRCSSSEECSSDEGEAEILNPVRDYIDRHNLRIDYIVLTKGIPIVFKGGEWNGCSIDSVMTAIDHPLPMHSINPYFAATDRFSHQEYGIYLVTRLIGWTVKDSLRLVELGKTKRATNGPIYLHPAVNRDADGYYEANQAIRNAAADLTTQNINVFLDQSEYFHRTATPMMGYFSWGSNDSHFDPAMYTSLVFAPGAIAETVVSTSGRTFQVRNDEGQSRIADLVADGVTGCKGYVTEPYVDAIAHADILFDDYTAGWNLADSFYAASRYVCWKDIVIGDPLCAPYSAISKHSRAH